MYLPTNRLVNGMIAYGDEEGDDLQKQATEVDVELIRLETEYRLRGSTKVPAGRYSLFNESALLQVHSQERSLLALLKRHDFTDLTEKKILDVGCGGGGSLRRFLEYGALPGNLSGIDLMAERIEHAQQLHPTIDWRVGSAHQLPYRDGSFDLVMSFVMFSSILKEALRQQIASEMWRVCKPGGLILIYDFSYDNPRNPAVQGMARKQIRQLFKRPGAKFDFLRITLAPPVARLVTPHSSWLAFTLEQFKLFNTHTIGIISLE